MKVCTVCDEIVSAGRGCARSDCPNQIVAPADPAPKVEPGYTGKADRVVQAGLDTTSDAARAGTRKIAFAVVVFLAVIITIGFLPWGKIYIQIFDFRLRKVEISGVTDDNRELDIYDIALGYRDSSPDIDEIDYRIRRLPWVEDVSITVKPPETIQIDIDSRIEQISIELPSLYGAGAEQHASSLELILQANPQLSRQIERADWVGNRRWDLIFDNSKILALPEGTDAAIVAFLSFARANSEQNLLSSDATRFDMRTPPENVHP